MRRPCSYSECKDHRVHWARQDEPRGEQMVEVPENYPQEDPVHCSMTCALMDGWAVLKYETAEQEKIRQEQWRQERKSKS
jgi:hypothetical protein